MNRKIAVQGRAPDETKINVLEKKSDKNSRREKKISRQKIEDRSEDG